jgi:hypothetical protein
MLLDYGTRDNPPASDHYRMRTRTEFVIESLPDGFSARKLEESARLHATRLEHNVFSFTIPNAASPTSKALRVIYTDSEQFAAWWRNRRTAA